MAGHPPLGTAFVLAREGRIPIAAGEGIVRFEEGVGTILVRIEKRNGEPALITMDQLPPRFGPDFPDRKFVARLLTNLPDGASVEPQATRSMAGTVADDITFTYTIPPLHHAGRKAVKIPVKTRTVVLQRGPLLYEIAYSADERAYDAHLPAFEGLLSSLQFR